MAKGDASKCTLKIFDSSSVFTDVNHISFKLAKENAEFRPHCLTRGTPVFNLEFFIFIFIFIFLLNRGSIYNKPQQLESQRNTL